MILVRNLTFCFVISIYLQVKFSRLKQIHAVMTQGCGNHDGWVTSYSVLYSVDGITWYYVQDGNMDTKV